MGPVVTIQFKGEPVTLTVQEARELYFQLEDVFYHKNPASVIKDIVAKHFGISPSLIDSRKRNPLALRARWLAMALAKDTLSIPEIAAAFDRNLSAIQNALSRIYYLVRDDPTFANDLIELRKKIKEKHA